MKQDISIITHQEKSAADVFEFLLHHGIKALHFNNVHDAKVGLALHSPTFLLLDFTIEGAAALLTELFLHPLQPRPYVIISANFLSGKDRAAMLRQGADACVDNPIVSEEILAVIETVLRREQRNTQQQGEPLSCVDYRNLRIDPLHRTVTMRDELIALTAKEFDVLYFLASRIGTVLTKEKIYNAVWKEQYNPKGTHVSDQISSIRQKLGLSSKDMVYIQTVIGVGYRFGTLI